MQEIGNRGRHEWGRGSKAGPPRIETESGGSLLYSACDGANGESISRHGHWETVFGGVWVPIKPGGIKPSEKNAGSHQSLDGPDSPDIRLGVIGAPLIAPQMEVANRAIAEKLAL